MAGCKWFPVRARSLVAAASRPSFETPVGGQDLHRRDDFPTVIRVGIHKATTSSKNRIILGQSAVVSVESARAFAYLF